MKKGYLVILVFLLILSLGFMIFLRKKHPELVKSLDDFNQKLIDSSLNNIEKQDSLLKTHTNPQIKKPEIIDSIAI